MITIEALVCRIAGRAILDGASAAIPEGHKVGLVGRNGSGKSTLLKLIAGDLAPDAGTLQLPRGARVGHVRQEAPAGPEPLIATVLAADVERTRLLAAAADPATPPERLGEIHERLAAIGADSAPARAARILAGLGFDHAAQQRPASAFSGGWRMRVALAAQLFLDPEVLLLDEPTNHLDIEATLWLVDHLKARPGTLILVSHDRSLLNDIPDSILHLRNGRLTFYRGNFDQFVRKRREDQVRQAAEAQAQEQRRAHLQSFVDRFRYKASKARQAQSRLKMLERMEPIAVEDGEQVAPIRFPPPKDLAPPLVTLTGAAVGYGDRIVLRNLSLRLDPDDRIALLGANGNGKSTLVKLIAGRLGAQAGEVFRASGLTVGYFDQHQVDAIDPTITAFTQVQRAMPQARPAEVMGFLGANGFSRAKAETAVGSLSGGERARLVLALVARQAPQLLLLDEPTNHLDIETRDALIEALNDYPGAVVLVAHDPHIVELTADRLWMVADGTAAVFDGDLDDYKAWILEQRRGERRAERAAAVEEGERASRRDERRAAAEKRSSLAPLKRKVEAAEKAVARLEQDKAGLTAQLADPALYTGPADKVARLQLELAALDRRLAEAEAAWLDAATAYEAAAEAA